jgi:uncharacterized protein (DUF3820 family)
MSACKYCGSTDLHIVARDGPSPHYGRIVCRDCGKFQGWAKAPMTFDRAAKFRLPFGKYAFRSLAEIGQTLAGRSYLRWLAEEKGCQPNIKRAIEAFLQPEPAEVQP